MRVWRERGRARERWGSDCRVVAERAGQAVTSRDVQEAASTTAAPGRPVLHDSRRPHMCPGCGDAGRLDGGWGRYSARAAQTTTDNKQQQQQQPQVELVLRRALCPFRCDTCLDCLATHKSTPAACACAPIADSHLPGSKQRLCLLRCGGGRVARNESTRHSQNLLSLPPGWTAGSRRSCRQRSARCCSRARRSFAQRRCGLGQTTAPVGHSLGPWLCVLLCVAV